MSLHSTGLGLGPTREERKVLHAGVSESIRPVVIKALAFVLCILVLPYVAHKLVAAYIHVPTMLPDDDSTSIFPTVASCLTVNAVLIGFILLAVRGDRANLKAADDKGKAKNKETKKDQ